METAVAILAGALILGGAIAYVPARKWVRKVRRRRGGIYLWRTYHHRSRMRRVTAYVGLTNSFHFRQLDHLGQGRNGQPAKPWSDLDPRCYQVIPLPWWLCWRWVMAPLETLVILLSWPVYNVQKNRWNPRRRTIEQARMDRAMRDRKRVGWR